MLPFSAITFATIYIFRFWLNASAGVRTNAAHREPSLAEKADPQEPVPGDFSPSRVAGGCRGLAEAGAVTVE
jgi:hypothetical protein